MIDETKFNYIKMTTTNGLKKPNAPIFIGFAWIVIAIVYIADRLINGLDIRLFDWIGWIVMFTTAAISIIEGLKIRKSNR